MADIGTRRGELVERFADFYEEVARIKLALQEGRLAIYLSGGKEVVSANANELAAMVSQRLKYRLLEQYRQIRETGTKAEIDAYRMAQYAMVAQADELFILDLEWAGQEAWGDYLLERALFKTMSAGRDLFVCIDNVLASRAKDPLQEELATVYLMALQLGFQGQYRGDKGASPRQTYRKRLLQFIGAVDSSRNLEPVFAQAYRYRLSELTGQRLAPLRRWYLVSAAVAALYLVISSAVWLTEMGRLGNMFKG